MKVILQQDIDGLGKKGVVVKVKDGYARNYLLPRGVALKVTDGNLQIIEQKIKFEERRFQDEKKKAEELAKRLSSLSCTISVDTHDNEAIYGSITPINIVAALEIEGISLEKKQILLDEPIKALGIYDIDVKLHTEVNAKLKLWVVKK